MSKDEHAFAAMPDDRKQPGYQAPYPYPAAAAPVAPVMMPVPPPGQDFNAVQIDGQIVMIQPYSVRSVHSETLAY